MENNPIVIFRTTDICNLNCTYCYDKKNRKEKKNINEEFEHQIDKIKEYLDKIYYLKNKSCTFIFHGGEPLILKPEVYEKLIEKIDRKNIRLSMQTNGTLINNEYIKLFKKYNISIGISLDGCNEEQNYCRIYRNGKNSFNKVMSNIELLKKNNIHFGIIMTITKRHIGKEKMIYDFIASNNLNVNIRPAFPTMEADNDNIMTEDEYFEFFKNMFNIWYNDKSKRVKLKQIREIYDEFAKVLEEKYCSGLCSEGENCFGKFISLNINGDIYSCNRTYNNEIFFLGNLNKQTIDEILNNANKLNEKRKKKIQESGCSKCEIYKYCYGGCPANAHSMYNDYTMPEKIFCNSKKKILKYIKFKLEETDEINKYNKERILKSKN